MKCGSNASVTCHRKGRPFPHDAGFKKVLHL